jgi:pimeloyl-ACP methyl ester carboxylesterase
MTGAAMADEHELRGFDLYGQNLAYVDTGDGPPVVLVHGLMSSHATWNGQIDRLAAAHRVLAPDLPGHGESDKGLGDYSLSAHAAAIRDLIDHLDIERVTLVGHSLGGGVAMQFAYLFPDRMSRLVLVSSGGFGREISPALRAATLPGSEYVLPVITSGPARWLGGSAISAASLLFPIGPGTRAAWRDLESLADSDTRRAFLATSRGVIDPGGQTVSAVGRMSRMAGRPLLAIWGALDRILPVEQARRAFADLPQATVEIFERSGHFPHLDEPDRFADRLSRFIDDTTSDGTSGRVVS